MDDFDKIPISGASISELLASYRTALKQLPYEQRLKLINCFEVHVAIGGLKGIFENMNNRTVGEIIKHVEGLSPPPPIEEGQIEEVSFRLFDRTSDGLG